MKASSPSSAKRESWMYKMTEEDMKVMICNPSLVETGLDFCWIDKNVFDIFSSFSSFNSLAGLKTMADVFINKRLVQLIFVMFSNDRLRDGRAACAETVCVKVLSHATRSRRWS